jgi:hypothetical protein
MFIVFLYYPLFFFNDTFTNSLKECNTELYFLSNVTHNLLFNIYVTKKLIIIFLW